MQSLKDIGARERRELDRLESVCSLCMYVRVLTEAAGMRAGDLEVDGGDKTVSTGPREAWVPGLTLVPVQLGEDIWGNGNSVLVCKANP